MTSDPVLGRLAADDSDMHHRVVEALLDLGGDCALSVVCYEQLPDDLLRRSAAAPASELRSMIAARPDCPRDLLESLARDKNEAVRCAVARNTETPKGTLQLLSTDPERWVRRDAFLNPSASDEARAAASLLSAPEDLVPTARDADQDPATPPDVLRSIAVDSLPYPNQYAIRAHLAENPSFPEDAIPMLVEAATHRWEWRSLWSRRNGLQGMQATWPSTLAFTTPEAPEWVLSALIEAGHPSALLRTDACTHQAVVNGADAVAQLVNSELLIRALWREMAIVGAVELVYWSDSMEGDHFFATSPAFSLMEASTPAEFLVGGYSESREWIETSDYLPLHRVISLAGGMWEEWAEAVGECSEEELDLFTLLGAAYAVEDLDVIGPGVELTTKGTHALVRQSNNGQIWSDRDDYDTVVTIRDSALPEIGYTETTDEQKQALVAMIQDSRSDPMLSKWGISDHFLKCIALHPATPEGIRAILAEDHNLGVREACLAGAGGAQAGAVSGAPTDARAGAQINTFVFSTLIPEGRFEEARIWIQQCIDMELGYESWNARSNLGVLEFMTGHADEARVQFQMVLASEDGPGFEAEEYLERLDVGEIPQTRPRLAYSEDWRDVPPQLAAAGADQQSQYLRFIRSLSESELVSTFKEKWLEEPGAVAMGFLDSVFAVEGFPETGIERDTAAKALADYMDKDLLNLPLPREAGALGAVKLAAGDRDGAEMLLRRAANVGDAQAALMLGTLLTATGRDRQGQAWLKVAKSTSS